MIMELEKHILNCNVGDVKNCSANFSLHEESINNHWWSGWPGAYCLKCGAED